MARAARARARRMAPRPPRVEVYGIKGVQSKSFRRVFASQAALERWLEKEAGNVQVLGTREAD